ncbi:MAG TPA: hypothetical protein VKZ98_02220 [Aquaticitalea sp.]|nr:hypothetical protein [Aquaticitalea sp.]
MHKPLDNRDEENYIENHDNKPLDQDFGNRWSMVQHSYIKKFPNLTDEDVEYNLHGYNGMIHRIATRTHRTQQEVENDIRDWIYDE